MLCLQEGVSVEFEAACSLLPEAIAGLADISKVIVTVTVVVFEVGTLAALGCNVGLKKGAIVGDIIGESDGARVGRRVGAVVGRRFGASEGACVGALTTE